MDKFDIEPGMTTWVDTTENYKKQYFESKEKKAAIVKTKPKIEEPKETQRRYKMPSLDVLITGSSRPLLWPLFWESYKKMCIIRAPHKVMYMKILFSPLRARRL